MAKGSTKAAADTLIAHADRPAEADRPEGSKGRIRLRGIIGPIKGRSWESTGVLRVGREAALEIVINHESVSRKHAELRATPQGWRLVDLGSTNGTTLNGLPVKRAGMSLKVRDVINFGDVTVVVEAIEEANAGERSLESLRVEATARSSWEDALHALAYDRQDRPRAGDQLTALLRAGRHLGHLEKEDDLLQAILADAIAVLDAQRGAIVLAEGPSGPLRPKAFQNGEPRTALARRGAEVTGRPYFSQSMALRCFNRGESILCRLVDEDSELAVARSVAAGGMASVVCVLLRTPRKKLGVLHLDRGPLQKAFTEDDLRLADALAASVSAGIECVQLLQRQKNLFLNTITIMAQAVELKDPYTGGHTRRVTNYSLMLGEQLELSEADLELIRIGTPLHDIGKIGIDDAILRKPDRLTPDEFELMKTHTVKGAEILAKEPDLHPVIPIVRSHHERWDGQGYPDRLAGEAIPRLARVVAVADAFDAMTSDRPYRKGMAADAAFAEVERMSGKQFDPGCAAGFLAIRDRVTQTLRPSTSDTNHTRAIQPI